MSIEEFKNDWRNMGQLEYLFRKKLEKVRFKKDLGDHEHCEFCSEKISYLPKTLNILRKIALNIAREYKNKYEPRKAISGILKRNLFDISNLSEFIRFIVALNNVTELLPN